MHMGLRSSVGRTDATATTAIPAYFRFEIPPSQGFLSGILSVLMSTSKSCGTPVFSVHVLRPPPPLALHHEAALEISLPEESERDER